MSVVLTLTYRRLAARGACNLQARVNEFWRTYGELDPQAEIPLFTCWALPDTTEAFDALWSLRATNDHATAARVMHAALVNALRRAKTHAEWTPECSERLAVLEECPPSPDRVPAQIVELFDRSPHPSMSLGVPSQATLYAVQAARQLYGPLISAANDSALSCFDCLFLSGISVQDLDEALHAAVREHSVVPENGQETS